MANVKAIIAGACGVVALLLIILIAASFSYLEFYQYGFKRQKSTGSVDVETIYGTGRHFVGPDFEFKVFPSDAHYVKFDEVAIFTKDKLEVEITVTFQYFLIQSELPLLHQEYDIFYEPVLESNALDALKGAATVYSTDEFISKRSFIEQALNKAVRERLGGKCCIRGCTVTGSCYEGCKRYVTCTKADKGFFAHVKYFQLAEVLIPREVEERKLKALLLEEETETERFKQNASLVNKETELEVKRIDNEAAEIQQRASATSELILSRAKANASAIREKARSAGLKLLYQETRLTNQEHKASFDYLRTLRDLDNVHLSINFDQLISGPTNIKP